MIMYALLEGLLKEVGSFCRAHVTRPLVSLYILRHGQAASLLSTIENGGAQCWILALFGEEFQWDRMHFRS